jgi:hypothetical protein
MAVRPPVLGEPPSGYEQGFFARAMAEIRQFVDRLNVVLAIQNDIASNTTVYPVWSTVASGGTTYKVSSTKLSFNPSTGVLAVNGLGLYTTPSANWSTTLAFLELKNNNVLFEGGGTNFNIASNVYVDTTGNAKYATANYAAIINVAKTTGAVALSTHTLGTANALLTTAATVQLNQTDFVMLTATGGLGYGTGSGGTVTQLTSKATAVTLNKPTGQITMTADALAAGASVLFALNNSLLTSTDLLVVVANNNLSYRVEGVYVTTGAAGIRVTNVTAGSLSEALQIRFAIIKGATA